MRVKFTEPRTVDRKSTFLALFNSYPHTALIFSRLEHQKEVIAIVPAQDTTLKGRRYWVWLAGPDGAYADGGARRVEAVAGTLANGEWEYQPEATMVMEHKRDG